MNSFGLICFLSHESQVTSEDTVIHMETSQCCFRYGITVVIAVVSLTSSLVSSETGPCEFPAIFNFGDSNSDTGGLSAVFGQARSPHGETFFHRPLGRYCDGRLILDFIAERVGLPYLSAYLDSVGSNFSHGANFATAGSTIRPQNSTLRQSGFSPISLDVQWNEFYDFQLRSQTFRKQGGIFKKLLPKSDYFKRALYTFDIGQNDLTAGYFLNMTTSQVKAYIPDVLTQFETIIKGEDESSGLNSYNVKKNSRNIHDHGGRFFWIHNTGPFGCLPYVIDRVLFAAADSDHAGCGATFNEVARFFNRGLKEVVLKLRKELPSAVLTYVDVYSAKYSIISQPKKYGFEQPLRACCGHGGKYNYNKHIGCGGKLKVHGKEILIAKACENPSVKVNWDGVHFTEAANKAIFDQIVAGDLSDPPTPLKMACRRHKSHS